MVAPWSKDSSARALYGVVVLVARESGAALSRCSGSVERLSQGGAVAHLQHGSSAARPRAPMLSNGEPSTTCSGDGADAEQLEAARISTATVAALMAWQSTKEPNAEAGAPVSKLQT